MMAHWWVGAESKLLEPAELSTERFNDQIRWHKQACNMWKNDWVGVRVKVAKVESGFKENGKRLFPMSRQFFTMKIPRSSSSTETISIVAFIRWLLCKFFIFLVFEIMTLKQVSNQQPRTLTAEPQVLTSIESRLFSWVPSRECQGCGQEYHEDRFQIFGLRWAPQTAVHVWRQRSTSQDGDAKLTAGCKKRWQWKN